MDICAGCGRKLKTETSRELGYGPVCYGKIYGSSSRTANKMNKASTDEIPYYEIPGQMTLEEFLSTEAER